MKLVLALLAATVALAEGTLTHVPTVAVKKQHEPVPPAEPEAWRKGGTHEHNYDLPVDAQGKLHDERVGADEARIALRRPSTSLAGSIAASTAASSRPTSSGRHLLQARNPAARAAVPSAKKRTLLRRGCRAAQDGRQ